MSTKTATQAGWSLTYSVSSSGFMFVTARKGDVYGEFHYDESTGMIIPGKFNDVAFFDLPTSVCQLIRFWFGTITGEQYIQALAAL